MKRLLAFVLVLALSTPAFSWNEKGHLVTSRGAWRQRTEGQRTQVSAVLKKHPHYEEYLIARKPDGFTAHEWAFMRAATWADWVRSQHKEQYDHPTWHYINYPIVWMDSKLDAARFEPPAKQENVVNQLAVCMEKIAGETNEEKAVYLTFESWGREELGLSKRVVYLNGELKVGAGSGGRDDDLPEAPAEYAPACGRVARIQIGKAGIRLVDQLQKLFR